MSVLSVFLKTLGIIERTKTVDLAESLVKRGLQGRTVTLKLKTHTFEVRIQSEM